jgi:hypothetical protein
MQMSAVIMTAFECHLDCFVLVLAANNTNTNVIDASEYIWKLGVAGTWRCFCL